MAVEQKIHPRNRTAWQLQRTTGNPVTTLLESGVGNCYPGLEMDIRNLERRFFPFLAVDLLGPRAAIAEVNIAAARTSNTLTPEQLATYERLAQDTADPNLPFWFIRRIDGNFGPFGPLSLDLDTVGQAGRPGDAWAAVRVIPEDDALTLHLSLGLEANAPTATLTGRRQAYLDASGALSSFFVTGEMTQSLCSPWTHDFRDCGCHYWASNHPDIAQLQKPADAPPAFEGDRMVAWQRSIKGSFENPPAPARADQRSVEMAYYEINNRWQELAIVLDGREQGGAYAPNTFTATPFPDIPALVNQLRYAAGVELGVMLEYITAAFSLRRDATGELEADIRAANSEIMRIAYGEMRHLRVANDVLRGLNERGLTGAFEPALRVASELPAPGGATRPLSLRPLTKATLIDFIEIERPSRSVDGLYGRIFATLQRDVPGPLADMVGLVMAEGNEHFETFVFVQDWLKDRNEPDYLIATQVPPANNPLHRALQDRYLSLLDTLFRAYQAGVPNGAELIAQARAAMLSNTGIAGGCHDLANAGFLVTFEMPTDPRFAPIPKP